VSGVEHAVGDVPVHYVEHGEGVPVLALHGAGVDHREVMACLEPVLGGFAGYRRIYLDLPGMGRTPAPETISSADDVLTVVRDHKPGEKLAIAWQRGDRQVTGVITLGSRPVVQG